MGRKDEDQDEEEGKDRHTNKVGSAHGYLFAMLILSRVLIFGVLEKKKGCTYS